MTPAERAEYLITLFSKYTCGNIVTPKRLSGKNAAIACVNQILEAVAGSDLDFNYYKQVMEQLKKY